MHDGYINFIIKDGYLREHCIDFVAGVHNE